MIPACIIVTGDFTAIGGQDKANFALALRLADLGVETHLVAHRIDAPLDAHPNVRAHLVPRPWGSHLAGLPLLGREAVRVARETTRRLPGTRLIANGDNCDFDDVCWVHMVHNACLPRDEGAPALFRAKNRFQRARARSRERRMLPRFRLAIANSRKTKRELVERVGVDPDRIRVVYLGADAAKFAPPTSAERAAARRAFGLGDADRAIAFVGVVGYDANKGLDTAAAAVERVAAETDANPVLLVAGEGAVEYWRARLRTIAPRARVEFLGRLPTTTALLAASDLLVSPTRYDAYGLGVQEALCRGVPAIASRAAGIVERYPDSLRAAILEDPNDAGELAARIRDFLADPAPLVEATRAFGETLRARSWEAMADDIVALLNGDEPAGAGEGAA